MNDININQLKKEAELRRQNKKKCFDKIKLMCLAKIKLIAKTGETHVWFNIPLFLLGHTSYKIENCSKYLIKKLEKRGFKTRLFDPNLLYIFWEI